MVALPSRTEGFGMSAQSVTIKFTATSQNEQINYVLISVVTILHHSKSISLSMEFKLRFNVKYHDPVKPHQWFRFL